MGAIGTLFLKAAVSFLESHPQVVENIVQEAVTALIAWIQTLNVPVVKA